MREPAASAGVCFASEILLVSLKRWARMCGTTSTYIRTLAGMAYPSGTSEAGLSRRYEAVTRWHKRTYWIFFGNVNPGDSSSRRKH